MTWTKARIIQTLRRLHRTGADLSYNAMARKHQPLLSAAVYHFQTYRDAVAQAGIDYSVHCRRPRWSKPRIIRLIKAARRAGHNLHWSAVTRRGDELGRAAFASVQPRLFGQWARALHAAGLDADDVSCYQSWDRNTITFELRARFRDDEPLNSGTLQREEPALHAAAVRHFGAYVKALRAARLNAQRLRLRRTWTRDNIIRALRRAHRRGEHLSDSRIRQSYPALHGAAVRCFGSFPAARRAAGIRFSGRRAVSRH
jgi:hypothetical protein